MGRVADILARKGTAVSSVAPDATAFDAVSTMLERGVGSLLVVEPGGIAGIFTERDYLRRVTLEGRDPRLTLVREIMTTRVVFVDSTKTIQECMAIMTERRFRHLPVVDDGRLVGVISIGDLVKHLTKEQQFEIRFLTEYITGRPPE